jgi:FtsZ-binding cell division protein ZapB
MLKVRTQIEILKEENDNLKKEIASVKRDREYAIEAYNNIEKELNELRTNNTD